MSSQAVAWAISHNAGSGGAKACLLSIANYANEYGECWASQATLAQGANCSDRQLRRILGDLEQRGLIEREKRGGSGKGRDTDMIRLRMRELPVILSARRREQQPDIIADSPQTQPDKMSASHLATGQDVRGATGQNGGGYRTMVSDNPKNPSLKERDSPSRRLVAEMRKAMSATGNQRTKPAQCDKALAPLIQRHGFDAVLRAARAFYATPQARKDGGEFQPGLQVIANDGRLEALIEAPVDPAELERRRKLFEFNGTWNDAEWGPRPQQSQGGTP